MHIPVLALARLARVTPAELSSLITDVARNVLEAQGLDSDVVEKTATVERPRNPEHGDYATNIAMQLTKKVGKPPREVAAVLHRDRKSVV